MGRTEPERTCVGCLAKAPKRTMIRMVRSAGSEVTMDPTGKAPGRGAYVHRAEGCVRAAVHRGGLGRALKVRLPAGEAARLMEGVIGSTEVSV
jgi:predicted RNA-binding protein YlxR (DUF448 family)